MLQSTWKLHLYSLRHDDAFGAQRPDLYYTHNLDITLTYLPRGER